nr:DNA methyltransferase [Candidatus Sigynarchaeota archaeon]
MNDEKTPDNKVELKDKDGKSRGFYDLRNRLNDLTGKEWVFSTKSVIPRTYPPSFQHQLRNLHGGQKPPELCAELIQTFTKRGEVVLDPFAGVGGTLIGCSITSRAGVGVEINGDWIKVYRDVCALEHVKPHDIINGDSAMVIPALNIHVDFILTDIPYWNMDKVEKSKGTFKRVNEEAKGVYSDKSKLGLFNEGEQMSKEQWVDLLRKVFTAAYAILQSRRYAAVFVGNMYNKGRFHFLAAEVASLLESIGFVLKGEIIWYDVAKKLHLYGINYEWIPSMVHQSILVFYKDDPSSEKSNTSLTKEENSARLRLKEKNGKNG